MGKIDRHDIQLIGRHSNISRSGLDKLLHRYVYNDAGSWQTFLRIFFITIGIGFTAAGVLMFFAYNWNSLGKFTKIGMMQFVVVLSISMVLLTKLKPIVKNTLLSFASVMVGVLFAVFGQIYQTGANAYDFFLGWTMAVTLWVLVSNFAPLWVIYLLLLNTSFILYTQQVVFYWRTSSVYLGLFLINLAAVVLFHWLENRQRKLLATSGRGSEKSVPDWFLKILIVWTVMVGTWGICSGLFDDAGPSFLVLFLLVALSYAAGIIIGFYEKKVFYLSIIPFSIVLIISALLMKASMEVGMFLFVFMFIVGSVVAIIKNLISLQKKWSVE